MNRKQNEVKNSCAVEQIHRPEVGATTSSLKFMRSKSLIPAYRLFTQCDGLLALYQLSTIVISMATTADSWLRDIGLIYRRTISQRRSMSASADSAPFIRQLQNLSHVPMIYEDVELLDYALEILPLQDLYAEAEDLYEKDKSWSTQDYLIRALLKYAVCHCMQRQYLLIKFR